MNQVAYIVHVFTAMPHDECGWLGIQHYLYRKGVQLPWMLGLSVCHGLGSLTVFIPELDRSKSR